MKTIFLTLAVFGLAACDANGNLGREESPAWHKRTSPADKVAYFKPRCEAYGFADGTPEMSSCIQNEIQGSIAAAQASERNTQAYIANMNVNRSQRVRATCTTIRGITNCY